MFARMGFVVSSVTATARTADTRASIAYNEGTVADIRPGERDKVFVPRSRDASGSSVSERGRVDVLGDAGRHAAPSPGKEGAVTMIVGGWLEVVSIPLGADMLM